MSQENVEIVRRGLAFLHESFESGEATDQLLDLCAPAIRFDASHRVFNPAVYEGREGVRRLVREVWEVWEDFQSNDQRLVDAGDRVVVIHTISGRGRTSGAPFEQTGVLIWTLRHGLVGLIKVFRNPSEALKAVGLEE